MKGLASAQEFHAENSGMPYLPFKIEEGAKPPLDSRIVRVLALTNADPERPEIPVIESYVMHQKFKILNSTRCAAGDSLKPDPDKCPLCRVKAPRTLRTFIPVRIRGAKGDDVHVIEYGRNNVQEVVALLEEVEGGDITSFDFKIKRTGSKKDTKYKWYIVQKTDRPLNEEELALEVPNIDELVPIKEEHELETKAMEWERSAGAKKTGGTNDAQDDDEEIDEEIPF